MKRKLVLGLFVIVTNLVVLHAQWRPVNMPQGPRVYDYAQLDSLLFAATDEGVFVSKDQGALWTRSHGVIQDKIVHSVSAIEGILFVGGLNYGGLWASSDRGNTWTLRSNGLQDPRYWIMPDVNSVVGSASQLFAGTSAGVFVSRDSAAHWKLCNNGLTSTNVTSLEHTGECIFAGTHGGGVFKMRVGDSLWSPLNEGLPDLHILSLIRMHSMLLVGTVDHGIYASLDSGATWVERNTGLDTRSVSALGYSGSTLIAGADSGVFRSTDFGLSWEALDHDRELFMLSAIHTYGGQLYAASWNGCYASTDDGLTWHWRNGGLSNSAVFSLAVIDTLILAGTEFDGIQVIDRSGREVVSFDTVTQIYGARAIAGTAECIYAGGHLTGLWRSMDAGRAWERTLIDPPSSRIEDIVIDGQNLFLGGNGGVCVSTDRGDSWLDRSNGLNGAKVYDLMVNGDDIFSGTDGGVYRSTDKGVNWIRVSEGLFPSNVRAVAYAEPYLFAGLEIAGVYRSTDRGDSWTQVNSGMPDGIAAYEFAVDGKYVFAATSQGVYMSSDFGSSWDSINGGTRYRGAETVVVTEDQLFACFGAGVWHRPLSEVITSGPAAEFKSPASSMLDQNFPNPFNPVTLIGFRISDKDVGWVKLSVFDVLGREVAVLVNERKTAGQYDVEFNGHGQPSGVYFYRLQVGGYRETKRCVLLR